MKKWYRLMNAAGGLGDGQSDGGGSDGGVVPPVGDAGADGDYVGPAWAKGWEGLEGVEKDILSDPSLKVFNNPTALLKSYVHAQKQLGKKGVMIPSDNSPKEEWDQFYAKVGVPLEEAKYKESLKFPEKNQLGEEFNNGYLKMAHDLRIKPEQAAKLYEYFDTQVKTSAESHVTTQAQQIQAELDALSNELGAEAYGVKLTKATNFLKETAGEDFLKYLSETGLGKNAKLVKGFMDMAEKLSSEVKIPDGDSTFGMTRADLEKEINNVMSNFNDPYHKSTHPDHKRRVNEIQVMFKKLEAPRK